MISSPERVSTTTQLPSRAPGSFLSHAVLSYTSYLIHHQVPLASPPKSLSKQLTCLHILHSHPNPNQGIACPDFQSALQMPDSHSFSLPLPVPCTDTMILLRVYPGAPIEKASVTLNPLFVLRQTILTKAVRDKSRPCLPISPLPAPATRTSF